MNLNPWTKELLTWHGHEKAGVKVPFDPNKGNPLGARIETAVLQKLVDAAQRLANGEVGAPRWIFLVGGPGNGKSEAVERFVTALDSALGLGNALVDATTARFLGQALLTRKVEIAPGDLAAPAPRFVERVGRLVIIQDASASDEPDGQASEILLREIEELMTVPMTPPPIFICCSNRGLLSSALQEVRRRHGYDSVAGIIGGIVAATALARDSGAPARPTCWPLSVDHRFACWPMDLESLLVPNGATSTFETILAAATDEQKWNVAGRCANCVDQLLCPFFQNRAALGSAAGSAAISAVLRRGELATGRRWNFRESFSLAAELLVGSRSDFPGHPCEWVHATAAAVGPEPTGTRDEAKGLVALARRLHPNALYPRIHHRHVAEAAATAAKARKAISEGLFSAMAASDPGSHHVREILRTVYSAGLDPALETPEVDPSGLAEIENHFNHSVENGLVHSGRHLLLVEMRLLGCLGAAEEEWEAMGHTSATNLALRRLLRQEASAYVKRSVATRAGMSARAHWIDEYSSTLRDLTRLRRLARDLGKLFGETNAFQASLVESFGQPLKQSGLRLQDRSPEIVPVLAPQAEPSRPVHDLPFLDMPAARTALPMTFDLFLAIRLRERGCANSCLPASTRSAIDRARQLLAGLRCRDTQGLASGAVTISVFDAGELQLDEHDQPRYEATPHGTR